MKQTINFEQFCDSFSDTYKDNFSYEGKQALFNYLEEYEESTDEELELDPIGLCCEYSEYKNLKELQNSYPDIECVRDLREHTTVILVKDDRFIIQNY